MLNTINDQRKLLPKFYQLFATTAQAPGGVARLRELILTLAVQGKLVAQNADDEPASELLKKIRAKKDRLIAEGKIKKDKPLAAITEEEKPFELPVGWEWARCAEYFVELCTGPFGSVIHQEDYVINGVPLINPSHMVNGRIVHDPQITLHQSDAERLSAYRLSTGDIVLARRGEVGRYAVVTERENGWLCGTGSFFLRLFPSCDRSFLALIFRDSRFRRHLQGESVGTTMTNLNQRILLEALIALPPLAEQSRIVARVEELMRLCDALEEKGQLEHTQHQQLLQTLLDSLTQTQSAQELARHWQRLAQHFDLLIDRPEAVDALEQTILQLAVRGLLVEQDPSDEPASELLKKIRVEKDRLIAEGKIKKDKPLPGVGANDPPFESPKEWLWVRLGAMTSLVTSGSRSWKDFYADEGATFIRSQDIKYDRLEFDERAYVKLPANTEGLRTQVQKNDLLITITGANVGKAAAIKDSISEAYVSQHVALVRLLKEGLVNYLHLWLVSEQEGRKLLLASSYGAKPGLNLQNINDLQVPLPPLAEQSRIVARVTELRALCQQLREKLTQARSTQTQLAQAWVEQAAA